MDDAPARRITPRSGIERRSMVPRLSSSIRGPVAMSEAISSFTTLPIQSRFSVMKRTQPGPPRGGRSHKTRRWIPSE
jgi:hypothetical protein